MKILIVDDEPLVRRSLSRALAGRGHQVVEAVDGDDGVSAWRKSDPDLVFLDVLMPKKNGPQVLDEIGSPRRAKVIMMSAFTGETAVPAQSADLFLAKPFEDIFQVVARAEALVR